jgi:alginate O-acetyltransferase complex protein AlgI
LNQLGFSTIPWTSLILPIGISFYTFETITYVFDVYRRVHKPLQNFWEYQLYIILFPKLIAGPIVRYHELADQIKNRDKNHTAENRIHGFFIFSLGLGKKVLIANTVGNYADFVFNNQFTSLSASTAWVGILCYTFQIYFDFSGYSDMAIGLAKMLGFRLPENFNNPYTSKSITEFWRRWHITLGAWMKNYLYIPLGGNRSKNNTTVYFNLWIVFLASGLWHGASWSFIIWGAYHGLWLVLERAFLLRLSANFPNLLKTVCCFLAVMIGWVFFRVESISDALYFLKILFSFDFATITLDAELITIIIFSAIFSFLNLNFKLQKLQQYCYQPSLISNKAALLFTIIAGTLFCLSLASLTASNFNPFIYFRF